MSKAETFKQICAAFCLASLGLAALFLGWSALQISGSVARIETGLQPSIENIKATTTAAKETTARLNLFITEDRLRNWDNAINTSIYTGQSIANTYGIVGQSSANLLDTLRREIAPTFNLLRGEAQETGKLARVQLAEIGPLITEARAQVHDNGEALTGLIDEGKVTIKETREEVIAELQELQKTTRGLAVITNDESFPRALKATAGSLENIQVITKRGAQLADYYIGPTVDEDKKPKGFFGKLKAGLVTTYRIIRGGADLFYIVGTYSR